ncbi:hypothetical protein [Sphingobacterium sp. SGL-16]|uniref:hypothetical protein n=1 Tax=Sphingobacterium sp. SGL-16 TaxID=2710883 RepID=UPI0013ECF4E7|nr:hypothetical protein [Sphingobacterium sp. SGL-16]NGM72824.1 hypothetical protein [Sphingobacterium sp. SGL-16]
MKYMNYDWPKAIFSAHLHHFLPHISWRNHEDIYDKFLKFHKPRLHTEFRIEDNVEKDYLLNLAPSILCIFHLGFHFETVLALGEIGLNFDILLDRDVYDINQTLFLDMQSKLNNSSHVHNFLFSDDRTVLLKIKSAIKEGRHVVIFADGNSGANVNNNQFIKVHFLNDCLLVRKGIPMISHILGVCIIPLVLEKRNENFAFSIGNIINPKHCDNRLEFVKIGMQQLYDFLTTQIEFSPWKWECWKYMHKNGSFNPGQVGKGLKISINTSELENEALVAVEFQEKQVVFNRANYMLYM